MTPVTWTLIALGAAFVAMAVSGLGRGGPGGRHFISDLRAWVRREPDPTGVGAFADARRAFVEDAEFDEGGVADIFDIGHRPEHD